MENKQRFPGFIGPSYQSRSQRFDCQRLVNMYLEMDTLGNGKGQEPAVLIGTPGLKFQQSIGNGPIRNVYTQSNIAVSWICSGNQIYSISGANATPVLIKGTMLTSTGPVRMSDNGTQIIIVDGQFGYYIDTANANTLIQITDPHFHATDTITFQDGYFIGVDKGTDLKGTGNFFISDLYSVTFLPLNEANASSNSDILIAAISCGGLVYMLGAKSLEIWADSGQSGTTPFARQPARISQVGCAAPNSVVVMGETIFWLGSNAQGGGLVYGLDNGMPAEVSNPAIAYQLQKIHDLSSATAYSYQQEGHYFYCLNIPGSGTTWVYDITVKQWHERQSTIDGNTSRHLAQSHCVLNGQHIVGDYSNSNIYTYDLDTYTDNGNPIERIRQTPHISQSLNRVFVKLLEVDIQFGVGLADASGNGTTPGSDPRIVMQSSVDGGQTWSNPRYASMGKIGRYLTRARWNRGPCGRDIVFRITTSEPVRVAMLAAMIDVEIGTA